MLGGRKPREARRWGATLLDIATFELAPAGPRLDTRRTARLWTLAQPDRRDLDAPEKMS